MIFATRSRVEAELHIMRYQAQPGNEGNPKSFMNNICKCGIALPTLKFRKSDCSRF